MISTVQWSGATSICDGIFFENMAHVGSFSNFVFVIVFVFVIAFAGRQWIVRVTSFRNMYGYGGLRSMESE